MVVLHNPDDIVVLKERSGEQVLWASECLLIETGLTKKYLEQVCRYRYAQTVSVAKRDKPILPDTGKSWRYARLKGTFYYDYDRLPSARREMLPSKAVLIEQQQRLIAEQKENSLEKVIRQVLSDDWHHYRSGYRHVGDHHAHALAQACAIVQWAADTMSKQSSLNSRDFLSRLAAVMDECGVPYVPRNWRRLKEKTDQVIGGKPVTEVITLPRAGNGNARRYDDPEIVSWMVYMRTMPQNYTNNYIIRKLRLMCELAEKRPPSKSWFERELAKPETKWVTSARFGSGRLGDRYRGYVPMENALHAGDCWMVDGTRVNMLSHKNADGKEEFLYWIAVYDVHSGDIIGMHFDTKEDRYGYIAALKMAVSHAGYLPYELVVDRFPGHNTEEIERLFGRMERLGTKVTITSKKTGKSKLERFFDTVQTVFMSESAWYYGEGVQSRRDYAHRSPEYLKAMMKARKAAGWDFDAAWREMTEVVALYRDTPLEEYSSRRLKTTPRTMHRESAKPHALKVEIWDTVELFGLEKEIAIRNYLLRTKIQGIEYNYRVDDYNTLAKHRTVRICYDMEDLTTVYLYENSDAINRAYLGTATETRKPQRYGAAQDMHGMGEMQSHIASVEKRRKQHYEDLVSDEAGDEVNVLLGGFADKADKSKSETAWLQDRVSEWKHKKGKPRLNNDDDTDDDGSSDAEFVKVMVRKQY